VSYTIIDGQRETGNIHTLCRALGVSVSGYSAWRKRPLSKQVQRDEPPLEHIRMVYEAGADCRIVRAFMPRYGSRASSAHVY